MNCYSCNDPLTAENESDEHVISNAIGGRLKSKNLLCKKCNDEFGNSIDAHLVKQLAFFSAFLNVARDRGEHPTYRGATNSKGESFDLVKGRKPAMAKPSVEIINDGNAKKYNIRARNPKELERILKGFQRKFPSFDVAEAMKKAKSSSEYMQEPLSINTTIGDPISHRAICKIAVNYFLYSEGKLQHVNHLIPFIKGKRDLQVVEIFVPTNIPYESQPEEIDHLIFIQGNSSEKTHGLL